jgi:hypothetical protein
LAGVRAPISRHWDVGVKVSVLQRVGEDGVGPAAPSAAPTFAQPLGTLTYNFGGAPESVVVRPASPAAPPPPPPRRAPVYKEPARVLRPRISRTREAATILDNVTA